MGLLKTQKLDNGSISFECIYGGVEAPFQGIDASKAPRYIDPKCFADASNFLIVDNELCICTLIPATLPTPSGITYPVGYTTLTGISDPAFLIGVGTLPCENIVKNWALYASSSVDSGGSFNYQLILWTDDTTTVERYNFPVYQRTKYGALKNATANLVVSYQNPYNAVQTVPEFNLIGNHPPVDQNTPYAYQGLVYEVTAWNLPITGAYPPGIYATSFFTNTYAMAFNRCNTPSSGPPTCIPTPANLVTAIIAYINSRTDLPFKASTTSDPNEILLTAFTQGSSPSVDGSAGNSLSIGGGTYVQEYGYFPLTVGLSFNPILSGANYSNPNPFSNPSFQITSSGGFVGGVDAGSIIYQDKPIQQLTWETIGDTLFLAGWPAGYMLQFNNKTKQFSYLTQFQGARTLKKMAGHLISAGIINSFDQPNIDNASLWFSWSAEGNYSQWNAVDPSTSLPTGAGGEQLADISDMLTGLVVSNSIAFILRAEGLSYASVQQNASLPFVVQHVDLCKVGQGCPSTSLWTQFDQLGFYVGTSNVFMLSQSPQAIGDRIIGALYPSLITQSSKVNSFTGLPIQFADYFYNIVNVEPLTILINNRPITLFAVNIAGTIYVFSPQDGVWMKFDTKAAFPNTIPPAPPPIYNILKCVSMPANGVMGYDGSFQYKAAYIYMQQIWAGSVGHSNLQAPQMYQFMPIVSIDQDSFITFPAEEISHGRDITIDAIYATISGLPGTIVTMNVSGWQGNPSTYVQNVFVGTVTLDSNAIPDQYEEYQFFNADGSAITLKAPQPQLLVSGQVVPPYTPPLGVTYLPYPQNSNPTFKCSKISMFGSFDPNQRPV